MFSWSICVCSPVVYQLVANQVHPRTCNRRVWLIRWHSLSQFHVHISVNTKWHFLTHQNKIQNAFFFSVSNQLIFIDQQADVGQETKRGVTGQGYIGGGYCHVRHVVLLISLSWLLFFVTKTVARHPAVVLFPDRLTHGGPLDDWRRLAGFVESVCVWNVV